MLFAPKVSVIIPFYNSETYINENVESLLNQTFEDFEAIYVDDGSTDKTNNKIQKYKRLDSRIKIIKIKKQNAGVARNVGLKKASGEYVFFLDSDDYFSKTAFEDSFFHCKETDADIGIYQVIQFNDISKEEKYAHWAFVEDDIPPKEVFNAKDMPAKIFNTFSSWPWNKVFKRSFINKKKLFFQDLNRTNDLFFVFSGLTLADRITTIRKKIVYYRKGSNVNSLQSSNYQSPNDFLKSYLYFRNFLKVNNLLHYFNQSFANMCLRGSIYNLSSIKKIPQFFECYKKLKIFFKDILRIPEFETEYFYYREQYELAIEIINSDPDHFLNKHNIKFKPA